MEILIDASAILAVLLNEPERDEVTRMTTGASLAAPACLEFEIGNALSALMKRNAISIPQAVSVYHEFCKIPVRELPVIIPAALVVSGEENMDAYDAYYLSCAEQMRLPMLTLDKRLTAVSKKRGIRLMEVQQCSS